MPVAAVRLLTLSSITEEREASERASPLITNLIAIDLAQA
jgi:hypothetical protein